jgi:Glycosyl hydrolase family 63 C-terminal domain
MKNEDLLRRAKQILAQNNKGTWTQPAPDVYPNQWFWDSCFVAIGLAQYQPQRAIRELRSLCAGQWQNGMIPHQIFHAEHHLGSRLWRSDISPDSPPTVSTSGITQPPLLAEAVWRIGEKLSKDKRRELFEEFYPRIVKYHMWLYGERNPHEEGLVVLLHPWETGMDDAPPWIQELRLHSTPFWIRMIDKFQVDRLIDVIREEAQHETIDERMSTLDALRLYNVVRRLRRKKYQSDLILKHSIFAIEDLSFNCILLRNNEILEDIAKVLHRHLPKELRIQSARAKLALEDLWDGRANQYYSRNFITDQLIKTPTIASLMPLYSRAVSTERAALLVEQLKNEKQYWLNYPVPTVPQGSPFFSEVHYWQGPTWINTNWLLIEGLRHYGYDELADILLERSIKLVRQSGFREYFSPYDGTGAGANNFSWTAALVIEMIMHKHKK